MEQLPYVVAVYEKTRNVDTRSEQIEESKAVNSRSLLSANTSRFRLSPRVAIELLSTRVKQLSNFITENSLEPPPIQPSNDKTLSVILHTLGLGQLEPRSNEPTNATSTEHTDEGTLPESMDHPEASVDSHTASWSMASTSHDDSRRLQLMLDAESQLPLDSSTTLDEYGQESAHDSENELAEQLSNRIGMLQIRLGGHVRFFGSTSNFHLRGFVPGKKMCI